MSATNPIVFEGIWGTVPFVVHHDLSSGSYFGIVTIVGKDVPTRDYPSMESARDSAKDMIYMGLIVQSQVKKNIASELESFVSSIRS